MSAAREATRGDAASAHVLFFLSGIAGLGYQIVWTRMFTVGLGHEIPSVLAVVAAFFAGLALGAAALDRRVSRSRVPGRWYAALETAIGLWALVTVALIPLANDRVAALIGVAPSPVKQWTVSFLVPLVALLPATAAMGATLPAMERLASRLRREGRTVGGLYAANTAGAVAGTLLGAHLLIPALGYPLSVAVLAAVNLACAAWMLAGPARGEDARPAVANPVPVDLPAARLRLTVFATGLLGIGYEVLAVRVLAQVLENTVFSFASSLSAYLVATAIGAALYQRFFPRGRYAVRLDWLLHGLAAACVLGIAVMFVSDAIYDRARAALGGGFAGSILAEIVVALCVFLLPATLMGATFSHLAQGLRAERGGVGAALALNTLGGAIAPVLFGVLLLSAAGAKFAILAVGIGYLALVPLVHLGRLAATSTVILVIALVPMSLLLVHTHAREVRVAAREGVLATAAVIAKPTRERVLSVNNHYQMGGTGPGEFLEKRQAHIPLLLHPSPQTALFLGLGTGITFAAADAHPGVVADGVELLPSVVALLPQFRSANRAALESDRLTVYTADARRFIRAGRRDYDVIVADLFHPSRDGSGSLYTVEHFRAARERLAPGGLFCQWLPLFQLDTGVLRLIVRSFLDAFPHAIGVFAYFNVDTPVLGLVGTESHLRIDPERIEERLRADALREPLGRAGLRTAAQLLGVYAASRDELRAFAGDGPRNTDARPRVTFRAPRFAYLDREGGRHNLERLLEAFRPRAADLLADEAAVHDHSLRQRTDDYLAARDAFLRGSLLLEDARLEEALERFVRAAEKSAELRAAYDTAIEHLNERRALDPTGTRTLLQRLDRARPERPEAAAILRRME